MFRIGRVDDYQGCTKSPGGLAHQSAVRQVTGRGRLDRERSAERDAACGESAGNAPQSDDFGHYLALL